MINCKLPIVKDRVVKERSEQRIQWLNEQKQKGEKTEAELIKEWPEMKNGEELYKYYMSKHSG